MTVYSINEGPIQNFFLVNGITGDGTDSVTQKFAAHLRDHIFFNKNIQTLVDDRLIHPDEKLLPLGEIAKTVFDDIISFMGTRAFSNEKPLIIVLYSFSSLLSPYIQDLADKRKIKVTFIIIDQPTVEILHAQSLEAKITHIANLFIRIATTLELECPCQVTLDQVNLIKNLAEERGGVHDTKVLIDLLYSVVPDIWGQILKRQNQDEIALLTKTIRLTLLNTAAMYNPDYKPELTASLQNTLIITTQTTMNYYGTDSRDLGWGKYIADPTKNNYLLYLNDPSHDHFSIINDCDTVINGIVDYATQFQECTHRPNIQTVAEPKVNNFDLFKKTGRPYNTRSQIQNTRVQRNGSNA